MRRVLSSLRYLAIVLAVLAAPGAAYAADAPAPTPVDMEKLLQDLRDLDSSTETKGDHVVGEELC